MHDIDFTKNPASVFQFKDKKQTLTQYYKAGYNLVVKEQRQPLIVYQQKRRNCRGELEVSYLHLVPELCKFAGLLDYQTNDAKFKQNLAKITKLEPSTRMTRINDYAQKIQLCLGKKQSSISLGQPLAVDGYCVDHLAIEVNAQKIKLQDGNFLKNIKQKIALPAYFENWMMVYSNPDDAKSFFELASKCAETYGIKFKLPRKVKPKSNSKQDFLEAITANFFDGCQIVVVVLDFKSKSFYHDIKKVTF